MRASTREDDGLPQEVGEDGRTVTGDVPQNLAARPSARPSFARDQWPALEDIAAKPRRAAIVLESRGECLLFAHAAFERLAASVSAGIVSARVSVCTHLSKGRRQFSRTSAVSRVALKGPAVPTFARGTCRRGGLGGGRVTACRTDMQGQAGRADAAARPTEAMVTAAI